MAESLMPQPDLRKQAQQGDPEAIALWLNHSLSAKGVTARVLVRDCCLKVLLTADRSLEKQAYMQFLQRRLSRLALESIHSVRVYGQKIGEASPLWAQEFTLPDRSIAVELMRSIDVKTVEVTAVSVEPGAELHADSHAATALSVQSNSPAHHSIQLSTARGNDPISPRDRTNNTEEDTDASALAIPKAGTPKAGISEAGTSEASLSEAGISEAGISEEQIPEVITSLSHIPVFPVNAAVDASIEQLFKRDRFARSRINANRSSFNFKSNAKHRSIEPEPFSRKHTPLKSQAQSPSPSHPTSHPAATRLRRSLSPFFQHYPSAHNPSAHNPSTRIAPTPANPSSIFPPPRPSRFAKFLRKSHPPTALPPPPSPSPATTSQIILSPPRSLVQVVSQPSRAIVRLQSATLNFWTSLQTFNLATIFPYQEVFSRRLFHNHTVKLLLFLGLFPLIINLFAGQASPAQTAWLLGIYSASIWGVLFYNLIRPKHFNWGDIAKCLLFTTFVGIPLLLYAQRIPPFNLLYHAVNAESALLRLFGFVFGVGLLEELCKALPVYFFLYRPARLRDPQTAAFYGAMSGLGFAIAEGFTYSLVYASGLTKLFATGLAKGYLGLGSYVAANTIRLVSLPLFHAILAGIVGYFIGLAAINPSRRWAILTIGLAIAAILHGSYNTFAGSIFGLLIIAFSILLFLTYLRRSPQIMAEMRQAEESSR